MAEIATTYEHIVLRDQVPMIASTSIKVIELVLDKMVSAGAPRRCTCSILT